MGANWLNYAGGQNAAGWDQSILYSRSNPLGIFGASSSTVDFCANIQQRADFTGDNTMVANGAKMERTSPKLDACRRRACTNKCMIMGHSRRVRIN